MVQRSRTSQLPDLSEPGGGKRERKKERKEEREKKGTRDRATLDEVRTVSLCRTQKVWLRAREQSGSLGLQALVFILTRQGRGGIRSGGSGRNARARGVH